MNKRVLIGILAIILFFSRFIRIDAATSYHEGEVEEYVIKQLSAANIPGVSLSIVTSQNEIYSVAFGDIKETSSDLQIGALTRTFTTLAIMQLVEKGDIKLDDSVYQYVDMSKRAGISANTSIQELLSYTTTLQSDDVFALYDTDTKLKEPSINAKFNLLGQIIEKVSGQSYASYIRENITAPLDMQSTYTVSEMDMSKDITLGNKNYFGLPLKSKINNVEDYKPGVPSNGLVSDVKDMGKYMQMYLSAGGKVVSYSTIETILGGSEIAGKSIFNTDAYYSMGWIITEIDGKEVYYCKGLIDDYTSAMFIIPSMDIGITMLFNSADALSGQEFTDDIEAGVVSLVMGGIASPVNSRDYLIKHIVADVIYFIAFVCALMPLLLMEVWLRWIREKFSVIRLSMDAAMHIILPTSLIFIVRYFIAPWGIIKKVMPDLFLVAAVVTGLFYFGVIVKLIAYFVIRYRKNNGYMEEEETDEEEETAKQIQERKDKLRKRMEDIKEAKQDTPVDVKTKEEPEIKETEIKEPKIKESEIKEPKSSEKPVETKEEKPVEKNVENRPRNNKPVKPNKPVNTEKKLQRTDRVKGKPEQARRESKPKRFIVVNDVPVSKNNTKNSQVNKPNSANKTGNTNKSNNANKSNNTNKSNNVHKSVSRNNPKNVKRSPAANTKTTKKNH